MSDYNLITYSHILATQGPVAAEAYERGKLDMLDGMPYLVLHPYVPFQIMAAIVAVLTLIIAVYNSPKRRYKRRLATMKAQQTTEQTTYEQTTPVYTTTSRAKNTKKEEEVIEPEIIDVEIIEDEPNKK